jgi:hypothetical protein
MASPRGDARDSGRSIEEEIRAAGSMGEESRAESGSRSNSRSNSSRCI